MAARLRPDAVVLDLRDAASRKLADRVRAACPETKVILWARDEDAMEVLDGGSDGPRRFFEAVLGGAPQRTALMSSEPSGGVTAACPRT